ncbi:uncharacterized protein LOC131163854 [Malania oleifera]|uniref:uncharacterized protein LOC131163854 n=1 Tax=Malania oleifera TaxID=397392 RepID=UPI0025AE3969|nr:uncharacterized protein LOC131163854 [Malania oleifera]XP_057976641.1 uncharacterized protein LOC131163854 [Malania oleifera]
MKTKQSNEEEEEFQQQQQQQQQQQKEQSPTRPASAVQSPPSDSRKRLRANSSLPSGSATAAPSVSSSRKKTRDLPNLYDCHSCKFHVSNIGKDKLRALTSVWRIVLLCKKCFSRVESAEICSYCFSETSAESLRCRECARCVHRDCVLERRDVAPWSYSFSSSGISVCVDCWVPKLLANAKGVSRSRKVGGQEKDIGKSSLVANSRDLENRDGGVRLEDVVKDANCVAEKKIADAARAKENALRKAADARRAMELASNALEFVVRRDECGRNMFINDEELALQLHRAINGSRRISRDVCSMNLTCFTIPTRRECDDDIVSVRMFNSGSPSVCGKLEVCTDNKLVGNPDRSISEPSVHIRVSCEDSNVQFNKVKPDGVVDVRTGTRDGECQGTCDNRDDKEEMPLKEGEGSCSNKLIVSSAGDNSTESESHSCQKKDELRADMGPSEFGTNGQLKYGEDAGLLKDEKCGKPDRYLRKYSKRSISLKAVSHSSTKFIYEGFHLESQASAPGVPLKCSKACQVFSDASFRSGAVPLQASACASVSSQD